MKISDIGGEFALIKRLTTQTVADPDVIEGIGDDCAVIKHSDNRYLLVTTDMMVENTHFRLDWQSPWQVGKKLMEVNVSDIVSMGGHPTQAFISLALTRDTEVEFMDELYEGLYASARKHGVFLVGGDTTRGRELVLNLALLGLVDRERLRLRSHAVPGDMICVTGSLGKSESGLQLLLAGEEGYTKGYLEPECRTAAEGAVISRYAHAMIDVSDGLASEVGHICTRSGTGALIDYDSIPISNLTGIAARSLSMDPVEMALYGGEDFELVFTVPEKEIPSLEKNFSDFSVVGKILANDKGIHLIREGKELPLKHGFDHFAL